MNESSSTGKSQRLLPCPECPRRFTRPSHLSRHQLTHLTASHKDFIPCPRCQKTFSRRDVLLRHLRSTHHVQGQTKRSAQKSCFRCVEKKLKCERTRPCNGCIRSCTSCEYPSSEEFDGLVLDGCDAGGEGPDVLPDAEQAPSQHDEPRPTHRSSWPTSFAHISDLDGSLMEALPDSISSPSSSLIRQTDDGHTSSQSCGVGTFNSLHENSAIPSSIDTSQPFDALMTDMGDEALTEGFAISPSYMSLMQPNYRTGGLDWLSFDIDNDAQNLQIGTSHDLYIPESWPSNMHQRDHEIQETSDYGVDNRAQHVRTHAETIRNIPATRSQKLQLSTTSWPFDQGHDSMPHRYRLPPLRDVLSGCWRASRPAQTTLVDGFIRILSETPLPQLANLRDTHAVQAFSDLQRLVDCYFDRFHDVQAILHKPTWAMSSCPPALLTAMACIGALLSERESDAELSWALGEICSTMITWMGASDATHYGDVSYLNALCLHQIYSLGSGNRQLYQSADRSRGILIGGLRGMGLLKPRSAVSLDEREENIPTSEDDQILTQEWKNWIMRESGRRAAWAAFEYDCSLCTLTSRRGVVDLSELPSLLPCPESIWNATSAQAWFALMSRLGPGSSRPSLSLVLKLALAGEQIPSFLGSWAKRLCSQVMGRLLWDLWQLEVVAMPEYCGLGSIISAHRDTKKSILKSLNNMVDALAAPSTTSDLISYNIASLLCHYSHLCAANGVLDLVIYIVRNLVSSAPQQHNGIEVARARLKLTFAKDPKTARRLCWHATQIVTIANEYLVSAPCEIMRVFMGYIFIIAYSTYGPHMTASPSEYSHSVRLDLHDHHLSQRRVVVKWIQAGGPASFGSVQDIGTDSCVPAISHDAQEMLQKLKCWGLAGKFTRIFQVLEEKGF